MDTVITNWQSAANLVELTDGVGLVVSLDFSSYHSQLAVYYEMLTEEERTRANRFHFMKDKCQFILARACLKILLGKLSQQSPQAICLKKTEHGKLYLADHATLRFNLSHSGDVVLYFFSNDSEVGIDVEATEREVDYLELAQRFFSAEEFKLLSQLTGEALRVGFYRLWTRKEAFVKAIGQGLSFPLKKFSVPVTARGDTFQVKLTAEFSGLDNQWYMTTFTPKEGYIAALASRKKWQQLRFYTLSQ